MEEYSFVKPERINLKNHPKFNELWIQESPCGGKINCCLHNVDLIFPVLYS